MDLYAYTYKYGATPIWIFWRFALMRAHDNTLWFVIRLKDGKEQQ